MGIMLCFVFTISLLLGACLMLVTHTYLISNNLTTIESHMFGSEVPN